MTTLTVGETDDELQRLLSTELEQFNRAAIGSADETALSVRLTDGEGVLVGGLVGWTWGGCGGITSLWVAPDLRRHGWGGRLLDAAEREIRRRGGTRVVVATMSFHAPGLYLRHGYTEVGRTPDMPDGTAKHHFHKLLDGAPRLRLVAVVDASPADAPAVRDYEDWVLALLDGHGGRLEQRWFSSDGCTEVQTISFAGEAGLDSFLADPRRAAYRAALGDVAPDARVIRLS